ncbi:hypothetical protein [Kushneria phosphatilytica]|uniref:Uncharacterized protein n=1 Tax=Kushneria phosphatilytica TaxID=657387 RepID=A0A1S1NRW1_9GAMM|nr:hypothetical protein [Kushneria phosphatilytica]OHV07669.1 hypothetical protein BH688_15850 [Kushneria phosphatilytica]QEL10164.1 hypothetical protein FY550_02785 [Kushneria phosphatilytica]
MPHSRLHAGLGISLGGLLLTGSAQAAVTDIDYLSPGIQLPSADIELYNNRQSGIRLNGGLTLYGYGATTRNANFGASESISGNPTKRHPSWWEATAMPTLTGEVDLPNAGTAFAGVTAVGSMTRGNAYGDVDGATPDHPEDARIDRAYLGWRSGALFADSLGKDALTVSFGRQKFEFGEGFLVGDGYLDTGKYGGYWIGASEGFHNTAILSLDSHGWHGDLFHLKKEQYVRGGPDTETSMNGINASYTLGDRAKFGAAVMHTYDSDISALDGTDIYNLRAKGKPFASIPDLSLGGQYVYEDNNDNGIDDDAWYGQVTYRFSKVRWTPELAYRHAEFSENYDTVFYDFAGGWGNWYMGEIVGEYMLFNSNLDVDMVRASLNPSESLETGIIGYNFRYHDTPSGVTDRDFAREVNLYADWNITDRLSLSGVYAVAFPGDGAEQTFMGNDHSAQLFELFATYTF